jgi:nitrite reductase/ring-hydroxylating ferredoxin subunit
MSTREKVATTAELPTEGSRVIVEAEGREIAIFRVEGDLHAVANFCVHQGGPLCDGELAGRTVVGDDGWEWEYEEVEKHVLCPWHGWMFDVTSGVCVDAEQYSVPTYDVEVENGNVFVVL